jgi:aerobic-type carbon monoxide dehydrogenase small subunit (CoxS/CutS family)
MADLHTIELTVNGQPQQRAVSRASTWSTSCATTWAEGLAPGLRARRVRRLHVEVDGRIVRGCLTLAVQADGCRVRTIEGLLRRRRRARPAGRLRAHNALQCGFCTPGMVMAAKELLEHKPDATRAEVREWMSGNYCRCTGYHAIVDAICETLDVRADARRA